VTAGYYPLLPTREDWLERRVRALEVQVRELQSARRLASASVDGGSLRFNGTSVRFEDATVEHQGGLLVANGATVEVHGGTLALDGAQVSGSVAGGALEVVEGTTRWADDAGAPRRVVGNADLAGAPGGTTHADLLYGDGGGLILGTRQGERGWMVPPLPMYAYNPNSNQVTTSASFVGLWNAQADDPAVHEVCVVGGWAFTGAATTGEVRLVDVATGQTTAVAALPVANTVYYRFEWLHPAACGYGDPRGRFGGFHVSVQARRTAGATNVQLNQPDLMVMTSRLMEPAAATNGHPTVAG
jgi:hypothetical protein